MTRRHSERLEHSGSGIDRTRALSFRWDGVEMQGHPGDTLASALLANGVRLVGRSFKYHRPRGFVAAREGEPNALVQIGTGARATPNLRATEEPLYDGLEARSQNAHPSLRFDPLVFNDWISPLIPAGFYYKTFKAPAGWWHRVYEPRIRAVAGLGVAPSEPDPDTYERRYAHAETLIVGSGPAGLAAAARAAEAGERVVLVEQDFRFGGSLLNRGTRGEGEGNAGQRIRREVEALRQNPKITLLHSTICFAAYDHGMWGLLQTLPAEGVEAGAPRMRMWWLRAPQAVLATGAIERPLVFSGNDRPGVMLASAAETFAHRFGVRVGQRAVLFAGNDEAYASALHLLHEGVEIVAAVDLRRNPEGENARKLLSQGVAIFPGYGVAATAGRLSLRRITIKPVDAQGRLREGRAGTTHLECDTLLMSGGYSPSIHLASHIGARPKWDDKRLCFRVEEPPAGITIVGDAAAEGFEPPSASANPPSAVAYISGGRGKAFVDFQNDATAKDLALAVREGYESIEHMKRYTTTGMATDQGKLSNVNAIAVAAQLRGLDMNAVGTTTFRPPYTPVALAAFAGREIDDYLQPERRTPLHDWAEARGAAFEPVGQWQRAWYFPKGNETMDSAVQRECKAVREGVGFMDASTLGKIELHGADAVELLNRLYTGGWNKLAVGRLRYGLMLSEEGVLFDDGVVARLGEEHFALTTTTGGAPRVLAWMEAWLQTEWPELRARVGSTTEQWAVFAINGPKARKLLQSLFATNLGHEEFAPLACQETEWRGVPARLLRVSFTGELGFEVYVPPSVAVAFADALMQAGAEYGITPYGTESMHLLRAEKGYIIAGQDNEGTTTLEDLGLGAMFSPRKDFLGKRGAGRSGFLREDRKQLVGLLAEDPAVVLPEGAPLAMEDSAELTPPFTIAGHVTSSYRSPTLGCGFAMALLRGGMRNKGKTISVWDGERTFRAQVVSPVFLDPEGARARGEDASPSRTPVPTDAPLRCSPFTAVGGDAEPPAAAFTADARTSYAVVQVRADEAALAPVIAHLQGAHLPAVGTAGAGDGFEFLRIGPDLALALSETLSGVALKRLLDDALGQDRVQVLDLSEERATLALGGPAFGQVWTQFCPLDLDEAAFAEGAAVGTVVAQVPLVLQRCVAGGETPWRIVFRRSYAKWMVELLAQAANANGGFRFIPPPTD